MRMGALLVGAILSFGAADVARAQDSAPVRVGVTLEYPPYQFVDDAGEPRGFDIDLIHAVARDEGFAVDLVPGEWSDLVDAFKRGELDVLAMNHGPEREAWASFSEPILTIDYSIFVREETKDILGEGDLKGREVIVEKDSLMHARVAHPSYGAVVVPVASEPETLRLLSAGSHDAALAPYMTGVELIEQEGLDNVRPSGPPVFQGRYCLVVQPGNSALLQRLDRGLAGAKASGEYLEIYDAWFGAGGKARSGRGVPTFVIWLALAAVFLGVGVAVRLVRRARERGRVEGEGAQAYERIRVIGSGAMGEVWLARHKMLDRQVAIKTIRLSDGAGSQSSSAGSGTASTMHRTKSQVQRFEREAKVTAALRSPHTIELYDFGITPEGDFFYAMELLDGIDLAEFVKAHGPVSPARCVYIVDQICHSLGEAHQAGLIHRDIKPANIFLCRYGADHDFVKVLDFGLVRKTVQDTELTMTGTVTGTPAFISPEVAREQKDIDGRADLYGVACIAYWLLTGCYIFDAKNHIAMLYSHVTEPPIPLSRATTQPVPEDLERVIMDCLAKEPADRPATAEELSQRLRACDLGESWGTTEAAAWWAEHRDE